MVPVQYIIVAEDKKTTISHVKTAIAAGCKWIQLQTKGISESKVEKATKEIKKICRENDVAFLIENNIELVKAIEADGIHLTDGTTVAKARQILGEGFLIGTNVTTAEEVISNKKQSADYLSCGPFSPTTPSIPDNPTLNINEYAQLVEEVANKGISLPLSAFGEILPKHVNAILKTGIRGIAIKFDDINNDDERIKTLLSSYINA